MTQLTIKTTGVKVVRSGLEDLTSEVVKIGRKGLWDFMRRLWRKMRIYPSKRAGQKYVRTLALMRHWKISKVSNTAYRIANTTPYTKWVVGSAYGTMQAWMHEGRWTTLRDTVDEEMMSLPKEVAAHLKMVARRNGL